MARSQASFDLDADVLRATRVRAARTGKRDSDVVEEALREYLGVTVIDEIWAKADLDEDAAMKLAYEELHAMRRERREAAKQPRAGRICSCPGDKHLTDLTDPPVRVMTPRDLLPRLR